MSSSRSNANVPAGWSQQDRRFGESIKQNLDTLQGLRGDKLDRAVTFRDLLDAGIVRLASGITNFTGDAANIAIVNEIPNLLIPPAPTNLQASGAFQNIILTWNLSLYRGHSAVQVWRHTSDSISSATMVAQVSGFTGVFADAVGSGQTFYYWVRAINQNDVTGPFNSSTGTQGQTAPDVNFLLTTLANAITTSELASSLSTPIAKIDPLGTFTGFSSTYSGDSLLTRMGAVETVAGNAATSAQLSSEQTARATADTALASDITTLTSTVSGNTSAISSEATTRASADIALSSSITTLQSTVGTNSASISTQASSINGLEAKYVVKIDNNGAVAGYGLASTANSAGNIVSEFIVNADRFAIMRGGSNTTAASVPFVVQASSTTLNGVTVPAGVYMTDGFIKNGSIVNAKIGDAAIDNAKIASLDAGKINAGTISTSRLNIDGSTLTSSNGVLQVNELNANVITSGSISATIMSGTTVYANRLTGDVNKLLPFRSTTSVPFRGNAASGGGTVVVTTQTLPATTHLTTGHKPFASVTGWYDSTNGKTYSFKLYMQIGSGSYTLVGETRFKANTNLYAQFAVSGSLSTATTSTVNLKLEVTRTGSSGIFDSDTSTTVDNIYEVSGFILGAR